MKDFMKQKFLQWKSKSATGSNKKKKSQVDEEAQEHAAGRGKGNDLDAALHESNENYEDYEDFDVSGCHSVDQQGHINNWVGSFRRANPPYRIERFFSIVAQEGANVKSVSRTKKVFRRSLSFETVDQDRIDNWVGSFRRGDPRYRIERFFNIVAQEGANVKTIAGAKDVTSRSTTIDLCFEKASVFTVWRPTSHDAIRRMMLGEGVGKGLDIKGKSAKKGVLSAFVPFLQIHEEEHKKMVQTLPRDARLRIYYENKPARASAMAVLRFVSTEMIHGRKEAKHVLQDPKYSSSISNDLALKRCIWWDMSDPTVISIDEFSPNSFGIEVSMRLFWEAYIMRQDVTRKAGSEYETGRPSEPAFQDMNLRSLMKKEDAGGCAIPVLWQHESSNDNPMCPLSLIMAYEEDGRVMPVVSDFDCFLVGSKRVRFTEPMPEDQLALIKWNLSKIESVLDSRVADRVAASLSWAKCWLKVLQEAASEGFQPTMPKFGFGDPRSYSIMEQAVWRLRESGCVRHGAECFNYYFPQELEQQYLVISKSASENMPWCYMNAAELQNFLGARIDEGYTFPLNPKWILCDPGWKPLYDKLLASNQANVQDSINIWYPKESGIRDQIEDIHRRHPNGFKRRADGSFLSTNKAWNAEEEEVPRDDDDDGTAAMDLATLELRRFMAKQRGKLKLSALSSTRSNRSSMKLA